MLSSRAIADRRGRRLVFGHIEVLACLSSEARAANMIEKSVVVSSTEGGLDGFGALHAAWQYSSTLTSQDFQRPR